MSGPFEVESALIEHEAVLESAVVPRSLHSHLALYFLFDFLPIVSPDVERGQVVKAFVVLSDRFSEVSTWCCVRKGFLASLPFRCGAIQPRRRISWRNCRYQSVLPQWCTNIFIHPVHRNMWKQPQLRTSTLERLSLLQACPRLSVARSGGQSWNIKRQLKSMHRDRADLYKLSNEIYEERDQDDYLCATQCK